MEDVTQSMNSSSARVKRLCNSTLTAFSIPSLPKLHGKSTLVTTKLCEQIYKSTAPHVFDLSIPQEHVASTLMEYNSLHDPYLKSYFHQSSMRDKLKKNGFITEGLDVVCSLKKYNAYRHFLEGEFLKIHQKNMADVEEQTSRRQEKKDLTQVDPVVKEREEKRRQFFAQQERNLKARQRRMRKLEREEEKAKLRLAEQRKLRKEKAEMKREAEREERRMNKLKKQHEETFIRKKLLVKTQTEEYSRLLQLHKLKQMERMKHINELEERWEKYEKHAQFVHEEEERRKKEEEEEKEKKLKRREKLFKMLQKREEERKQKVLDENHYQVELLREEAEKFENHWKKVHDKQVIGCREKMKKQHEIWSQQQRNLSHRTSVSTLAIRNSNQKLAGSQASGSSSQVIEVGAQRPVLKSRFSSPHADVKNLTKQTLLATNLEVLNEVKDSKENREQSIEKIVVESASGEEISHSVDGMQEKIGDITTKLVKSITNSSSSSRSGSVPSGSKSVRFDIPSTDN